MNGTHQLPTCADDVTLLGDNIDIVTCFEIHVCEVALTEQRIWNSVGNRLVEADIHSNAQVTETTCGNRHFLLGPSVAAEVTDLEGNELRVQATVQEYNRTQLRSPAVQVQEFS
jgi:hypothetical protein